MKINPIGESEIDEVNAEERFFGGMDYVVGNGIGQYGGFLKWRYLKMVGL